MPDNTREEPRAVKNGMPHGEYVVWTQIAPTTPSKKPYHVDAPVELIARVIQSEVTKAQEQLLDELWEVSKWQTPEAIEPPYQIKQFIEAKRKEIKEGK